MDVALRGGIGNAGLVGFESSKKDSDAPGRSSETRLTPAAKGEGEHVLRRTRRRAMTLRNQGWSYEMKGREAAFREASGIVKKWLTKDRPLSAADVEFVIELLDQSADLYASAQPKKPGG